MGDLLVGKSHNTVLVVDDDPVSLKLLLRSLEPAGYHVLAAVDATMALDVVSRTSPDIILLDVRLPDMDGFELCRRLKARLDIPIIFITGLDDVADKVRGFSVGAVDYITKPLHVEEVIARVNAHTAVCNLQKKLERQNMQLEHEVAERRRAEAELVRHRDHLEELVAERMAALKQEVAERMRAEEALRYYARRLEIQHEIDRAILAAQSPDAIAQVALCHIRRLVPCSYAAVVMFDFETGEATVLATDADSQFRQVADEPANRCFLLDAFKDVLDVQRLEQGQLQIVQDIGAFPSFPLGLETLSVRGMRACINVPLIVQGTLIGLLGLGASQPGAFGDDYTDVIREIADSLAIVIQNARLFQSVNEQREHLRALAARLAESEEAERQRLARELHDQVGQNLTGLGINLNILRSQLSAESASKLTGHLNNAQTLLEETVERIRGVMAELRPAVLDDYGLRAALCWYGERFSTYTGVAVVVEGEFVPRLLQTVETAMFRIAQEALNNVAKHAQANQVTLKLETLTGQVCLTIADDGRGFDTARFRRVDILQGWGVRIMQERVQAVGGQLCVESMPGKGTRIVIQVPR